MPLVIARHRTLSLFGWVRVTVRLVGMLALLLAAIPLYYLCHVLPRRNPVPRLFLGGIAWLGGIRIETSGTKSDRSALLLANHVSWIDIPAIAWTTGSAFVGHDGLASMPLLKWLCAMNDTVFVARHDRQSVQVQIAAIRAAMMDAGALTLFPEGTTSDGTGLLAFKSSLLSALEPLPQGVAVQPVALDFGGEAAQIAWIGEEAGLDNFLRVLARRRPVCVRVVFLPPLTGAALENRKTIAQAARVAILQYLTR